MAVAHAATPPDVTALVKGLQSFATFSHGLASDGLLGQPLPDTGLIVGGSNGLGFGDLVDQSLYNPANASEATDTSLSDLASALTKNGVSIGGGRTATTVAAPSTSGTVESLAITDTVMANNVPAALLIDNASPQIVVSSEQGLLLNLQVKLTFAINYDTSGQFVSISTSPAPTLSVDVTGNPAIKNNSDASVGILDATITNDASSPVALAVHFTGTFAAAGANEFAFSQPSSGPPATLLTDSNAGSIVNVGYAASPGSSFNGTFDVTPNSTGLGGLTISATTVAVTISDPNLATQPMPTISGAGFSGELANFESLTPHDLADGLGQLRVAIRAVLMARGTNGDVNLPFLHGSLSDAVPAEEGLTTFLGQHVDPKTGNPDFSSLQTMFSELQATSVPDGSIKIASPTYNSNAQLFTFTMTLQRTSSTTSSLDPGTAGCSGSPAVCHDEVDPGAGAVEIGDALRSQTGVSGANTPETPPATPTGHSGPPPTFAQATPSYDLAIPVVINLAPPVTGSACQSTAGPGQPDASASNPNGQSCPYKFTDSQTGNVLIVTSLPLPVDRFAIDPNGFALTATSPITTTIPTTSPVPANAGFAAAAVTGTISVDATSNPELSVKLTPPSGHADANGDLSLAELFADLGSLTPMVDLTESHAASASASLSVQIPNAPDFFGSGNDTTSVTVSVPDITSSAAPAVTGTAADLAKLTALDTAGSAADVSSNVITDIRSLATGLAKATGKSSTVPVTGGSATLSTQLPFMGSSFGSLFDSTSLAQGATAAMPSGSGVPASLQSLLSALASGIGVPSTFGFTVDTSQTPALLVLKLNYTTSQTVSAPLDFATGSGEPSFAGPANPALSLKDSNATAINLAVPLGSGNPSVTPDSTFGATATNDVENGQYDGTAGPLQLRLGDTSQSDPAVIKTALGLTAQDTTDTGSYVDLATWLSNLSVTPDSSQNVSCTGTPSGSHSFCADLPAYKGGTDTALGASPNDFQLNTGSTDPSTLSVAQAPSGFSSAVSAATLHLSDFGAGFDALFTQLTSGLNDASEGGKLPFVGNDLQEGSKFIKNVQDSFDSQLSGLPALTSSIHVSTVEADVSNAINAAAGSIGATASKITLTVTCDDNTTCDGSGGSTDETADHILSVEPSFTLQGTVGSLSLPFKIGIPGLSFSSDGSGSSFGGSLTWTINVDVGISKSEGFYVVTGGTSPQLTVALQVTQPTSPFSLNLAFVNVEATPASSSPVFNATFGVTIGGPPHVDLANLDQATITPSLSGGANVDWNLDACLVSNPGQNCANSALPGLTTEFKLTWNWSGGDPFASSPNIEFDNVSLDVSSFVKGALGNIGSEVATALAPIKPVVDTITAPIPVLSDLSHLVGGPDITLLAIAEAFSNIGGSQDTEAIQTVINLAKEVADIANATASGSVNFGSYVLNGSSVDQNQLTPSGVGSAINDAASTEPSASTVQSDFNSDSGGSLLSDLTGSNDGFDFPLLDNPKSLINVLLGQDANIVTYDTGKLNLGFSYRQDFGPIWPFPPVFVTLSGSAAIGAELKVGIDTSGLRQAFTSGTGATGLISGVLNGFFIDTNVSHVTLSGDLAAGAEVNIGVASAGAEGGISLTLTIGLTPNTGTPGKFYLFQAQKFASNFFCIFTISGNLSAFLDVYVSIDVLFYSHTWTYPIANVTLLDFSSSCPQKSAPPPTVAEVVPLTGPGEKTLVLNVGDFGTDKYRNSPWGNDDNPSGGPAGPYFNQPEQAIVHELYSSGKMSGFEVQMLGQDVTFSTSKYPGLDRVYADASNYNGTGNGYGKPETIQLLGSGDPTGKNAADFNAKAVIFGGAGGDTIKTGNGPLVFQGGKGDDHVTAGDAGNLISGGPGNDVITSGNGGDHIYGDALLSWKTVSSGLLNGHPDPDQISVPTTPDTHGTTDGNDTIIDGSGHNVIYGDGGDDRINASEGAQQGLLDPSQAPKGSFIVGGTGNNTIQGSLGPDQIWPGQWYAVNSDGTSDPNATGATGDGTNFVDSGTGSDFVYGGSGSDTIIGHSLGTDNAPSGTTCLGKSSSAECDIFYGAGGNDVLTGGDGADQLYGGSGNDYLSGGPAQINTSTGAVQLTPDGKSVSSKLLVGGGGNDTIYGANDPGDTIFGDYQDETCTAPSPGPGGNPLPETTVSHSDDGNDTIFGGSGADTISGGGGNDHIDTGSGNDLACGGPGNDTLTGHSSATQTDTLYGGPETTASISSGNDSDSITGGSGNDLLFGGDGNDTIVTGTGNDYAEGGPGTDAVFGQSLPGQSDHIIGGTSLPATSDSGDVLFGGQGNDVVVGDNGIISSAGVATVYDLTTPLSDGYGGADFIFGGAGDDKLYGGLGADYVNGGTGNDYIEGGPGCDTLIGGAGDDDILGGTSPSVLPNDGTTIDQVPDGCDSNGNDVTSTGLTDSITNPPSPTIGNTIYGDDPATPDDPTLNAGYQDAIVGGNGSITETGSTVAPDNVPVRTIAQYDIAGTGATGDLAVVGGNDSIFGGPGDDQIFGGVGDDLIKAGPGDNYVEGGPGSDKIYGGTGNNDIIGGSSPLTLPAGVTTAQVSDGSDTIYADGIDNWSGGTPPADGANVVLGDNGSITRPSPWTYTTMDPTSGPIPVRTITQLDIYDQASTPDVQGAADAIFGGFGDDKLFGEVGNDSISGGPPGTNSVPAANRHDDSNGLFAGNDYAEGGPGSDTIAGGAGDDDLIGGVSTQYLASGRATEDVSDGTGTNPVVGNTIDGGGGNDVIVGGHGIITHPLNAGGFWQVNSNDGAFVRNVVQCDVADSSTAAAPVTCDKAQIGGNDTLRGGSGDDNIFGGIGNDFIDGGPGNDYLEGGPGSDYISGGSGDDDVVGGSSPVALPLPDTPPANTSQYLKTLASNMPDGTADATVTGQLDGNVLCGYECGQSTSVTDDDAIIGNNGEVDRCPNAVGSRAPDAACTWGTTNYGFSMDGSTFLGAPQTRYPTLLGESLTETNHAANDYIEGGPGNDLLYGEDGNDVIHGDTANQSSPAVLSWTSSVAPGVVSANECLPTSDPNAGQDILIGGYGNDVGCGDGGDDALLGDRGTVTVVPFSGKNATISSNGPPNLTATFPSDGTSPPTGDTIYQVTLIDPSHGGNDILFGGQGNDSLHGGAGDDFLQGDDGLHISGQPAATGGNDILFGDQGNDSLEGGPGNDHLYGGAGSDDLDVIRGTVAAPKVDDNGNPLAPLYPTIAAYTARFPLPAGLSYDFDPGARNNPTTANGDIQYGGHDRDIFQADNLNDRLVDSFGNYNLYFVCPAAYGGSQITRSLSPGVLTFMQELAQADGAVGAATPGTSGFDELSLVFPGEAVPDNAGSAYPTTPGHFTC